MEFPLKLMNCLAMNMKYMIYKLVNFNENNEMSTAATMLITFLVVATIIIIMIMIWLINYMIWNI